jgi:hypothetical protein
LLGLLDDCQEDGRFERTVRDNVVGKFHYCTVGLLCAVSSKGCTNKACISSVSNVTASFESGAARPLTSKMVLKVIVSLGLRPTNC